MKTKLSRRFLVPLTSVVLAASLSNAYSNNASNHSSNNVLKHEIIETEKLKKGGQIEPLIKPKYTMILIKAALLEKPELTKTNVDNTLRAILENTKKQHRSDAIAIKLFRTKASVSDPSTFFAEIDWWPKGKSLSPKNASNIDNKSTYITDVSINLPRKMSDNKIVARLSEIQRKNIFKRKGMASLFAIREANKRYPMETLEQIKRNSQKNLQESDRLSEKYDKEINAKFNLTEEEADKITNEGINKRWPMQ